MHRIATVPDIAASADADKANPGNRTVSRRSSAAEPGSRPAWRVRLRRLPVVVGYLLLVAALVRGWQLRDAFPFTAEHGVGYALGILGGSMMLALLIYPLRKRLPRLRFLGPVPFWFRLHMTFGLLGPLFILYHSGFHLGSTNANAALFCMLTVALSGLVGRYLYTRIHKGLYGKRATIHSLRQEMQELRQLLVAASKESNRDADEDNDIGKQLDALESDILAKGMPGGRLLGLLLPPLSRFLLYRRVLAILAPLHPAGEQGVVLHRLAYRFSTTFVQLSFLGMFERLFSVWHVLHLPLFLLLVISGIVHVVFVHMY